MVVNLIGWATMVALVVRFAWRARQIKNRLLKWTSVALAGSVIGSPSYGTSRGW